MDGSSWGDGRNDWDDDDDGNGNEKMMMIDVIVRDVRGNAGRGLRVGRVGN